MSSKVLAFINFKGGVGKTATVVNIGATLAKLHEKKVLIVDLDPQSNSSVWLMRPDRWREHVSKGRRSSFQIYDDALHGKARFDFDEAVVKGVVTWTGFTDLPRLHLLPAAVELLRIEDRIHELRAPVVYQILDSALGLHFKGYDYVLLDCPPNLYSTTKTAIFAADGCVVPYVPDYLSLSGLMVLAEQIAEMREKFAPYLPARRKPNIAAVIVSHYRQAGNVFRLAVNELELSLSQLHATGLLSDRATLLQPYIRHCVRVAESTSEHLPVILYAPASIGAQDYCDLTQRFVDLFEGKK
ncbi:MAG: ParA family protein [Verrucomicrobia bacterium]|nr:ParA family protein [Verrucomicrobiota bacterium]